VNNEEFTISMATSTGVLCGAGFETPAEALFLRKKLLVIPMKQQYEQYYNAAALKQMNVPVVKRMKKKHLPKIEEWIESSGHVHVQYENISEAAVTRVFELANKL
jgi:uncharacterized protein (TIGR00661 family)